MARRVCFALDLIADADLIADYERAHAAGAVWPDVTDAIRAKGFEAMEIWRTGDRLFMIAEVAEDWPRAIPSDLAATDARWEAAMDRFQKPLPHAAPGEKWVAMERIYSLDDQ
ncbi:L-rhamnose mutarotase [Sphingomonas paucimobilis]|uniref:L-rhamnose mutarotase n=1 Tax=Sphingomonas paucimobilis TaxID=13689 RepID=UPI00064C3698|nr:L-rhamnose mutarotase [Sphingomonas paucimobilis]